MSQYDKLDEMIIKAIGRGDSVLYNRHCGVEASRLADLTGREEYRIIDARLQAMRKAGKIEFCTKAKGFSFTGWRVV